MYLAALTANLRLASEMRDGWDPAASKGGVDLTDVDPIAAEQAISNVVENAITHGIKGGHVAVVLETSGGRFSMAVADDGPGLLPSELPRLGERTFRSDDARQRDPRGSGLGLAITHEVCKRCGWRLAFEPETPHGLRLTMQGAVI